MVSPRIGERQCCNFAYFPHSESANVKISRKTWCVLHLVRQGGSEWNFEGVARHSLLVTLVTCPETVSRKNKWDFFFHCSARRSGLPQRPTSGPHAPRSPRFNAGEVSLEWRMGETGRKNGTSFAPALTWGGRGGWTLLARTRFECGAAQRSSATGPAEKIPFIFPADGREVFTLLPFAYSLDTSPTVVRGHGT